jgi:hypothetical protein
LRRIIFRLTLAIGAFILAVAALAIALAFGLIGIYFWLADYFGAVGGAFATAGASIALSAALIGIGYETFHIRRKRRKKGEPDPNYFAAFLGDLLGRGFGKFTASRTHSSIFASLAAGFAIGASPKLREFLLDIVRS